LARWLASFANDFVCGCKDQIHLKDRMAKPSDRYTHEIEHGKYLAAQGAEQTWGWGSPAGQQRSIRRGRLIAEAAHLAPGQKALEIGCGTGLFTRLFAESGAEILAVDISQELIELAGQQKPPRLKITFRAVPFEDPRLTKDGPFDAVIGSSVLHHLEVKPALQRIFQLLKPEGILAFAEPNMLNPQVAAERSFLRPLFKYTSPDETAFVRWSLARKLSELGFVEIRIKPFDWLHPAIPPKLIDIVKLLGGLFEAIPFIREFSGSLLISAKRP
jgi:2-polyprenyl-3-methyl-5-hydroxy-6-metoxy-1,4-benzoquinol methylase